MQLSVSLIPAQAAVGADTDVAVVIDVLRATSVIAAALSAGAQRIVTCREVSEAKRFAESMSPRPLLCGERGCQKIDGFDLGNSPADFTAETVRDRTLVLTTTNGTGAIASAKNAGRVITASFLNFSSVAESLRHANRVHFVCAGTDGQVTAEDVLLAGALVAHCETEFSATPADDPSILARQLWRSWFASGPLPGAGPLSRRLRETAGGRNLLRTGFPDDLDRCAAIDSAPVVPERVSDNPTTFELLATAMDG